MPNAITIDSFEYFFGELSLRKGLQIFQRNNILLITKMAGGDYSFECRTSPPAELKLKKKANKIVSYNCSCGKTNCEHLCAAVFYFAKDNLHLIDNYIGKIKKLKDKSETTLNDYGSRLKKLIKKNLGTNALNVSLENDKLIFDIIKFIELKNANACILHLSVLNELSSVFNYRKNLTDTIPNNVLSASVNALNNLKRKGLEEAEKKAWLITTKNSLKNNTRFNSGTFNFLIPYAVSITKEKKELDEFRTLISKRKFKQEFRHYLNMHEVAQLQIWIKEAELLKKPASNAIKDLTPELSVANAELKFCLNKPEQGFKILLRDYEKIKQKKPASFLNYLKYLINKAKELHESKAELFFIREIIFHDHIIPEKYLLRLKTLIPKADREKEIDLIIKEIKKQLPEIYFNKLCQLLESENRLDDLIIEANKQANKFPLIHKIALKKLPQYNAFLLNAYVNHLVSILYEARESYHQKQIFDKAKSYLDQLPKIVAAKLVAEMLEKISKNNFIYSYLKRYSENL